jgi:MOSC domain-containing protein YiiM
MKTEKSPVIAGRVASLHLHPATSGEPFQNVPFCDLVSGKGIVNDSRFFGRISQSGRPSRRQVTLMEREQIFEHAKTLRLPEIPPGAVRSNVETIGINLIEHIGQEISIGETILHVYAPRDPCAKMDKVCHGLRELMLDNRQGVLAEVIQGGRISAGDSILLRPSVEPAAAQLSCL